MRRIAKNAMISVCRFAGVYGVKHKQQQNLLKIICYHRFVNDNLYSAISRKYLPQEIFARQIGYLKSHFNIQSIESCIDFRNKYGKFPSNTLALTVDDGYEDFFLYAYPVLKNYGVPATVYIIYDFTEKNKWLWQDKIKYSLRKTHFKKKDLGDPFGVIDISNYNRMISVQLKIYKLLVDAPISKRHDMLLKLIKKLEVDLPSVPSKKFAPLNWDQIKEMSKNGIWFGSHTLSHEVLTTVSSEQLEYEIKDSKCYIEKKSDLPIQTFCYPHGKINDTIVETVAKSGYQGAVAGVGVNKQNADCFRLRRLFASTGSKNAFMHSIYHA